MQNIFKTLLAVGIASTLHTQTSLADEPMPSGFGGTELYGCEMNEGKTPADLMSVVGEWNAWSDEKGMNDYYAWVLNPVFASDVNFERTAFWFGFTPDFKGIARRVVHPRRRTKRQV